MFESTTNQQTVNDFTDAATNALVVISKDGGKSNLELMAATGELIATGAKVATEISKRNEDLSKMKWHKLSSIFHSFKGVRKSQGYLKFLAENLVDNTGHTILVKLDETNNVIEGKTFAKGSYHINPDHPTAKDILHSSDYVSHSYEPTGATTYRTILRASTTFTDLIRDAYMAGRLEPLYVATFDGKPVKTWKEV